MFKSNSLDFFLQSAILHNCPYGRISYACVAAEYELRWVSGWVKGSCCWWWHHYVEDNWANVSSLSLSRFVSFFISFS